MTVEILQPEAGDDRNKDVEIAKLYEMVYANEGTLYESDTPGFSPGEVVFEEAPKPPHSVELRREARYIGRRTVSLAMNHSYPIQRPRPMRRAHIIRSSPLN